MLCSSRLKGLYRRESFAEAEEQVDQAIRDVALFEKRNTLSKNLSGGMKRKLSVAVAFCGGSTGMSMILFPFYFPIPWSLTQSVFLEVIFLDEPTSGTYT